jgi:hypothetical protein
MIYSFILQSNSGHFPRHYGVGERAHNLAQWAITGQALPLIFYVLGEVNKHYIKHVT